MNKQTDKWLEQMRDFGPVRPSACAHTPSYNHGESVSCPNCVPRTKPGRSGRVAILEQCIENAAALDRKDCEKALAVLSGAGICTPEETYGDNTSWAIGDLCRAVTQLSAALQMAATDCHLTVMRNTPTETLVEAWMDRAKLEVAHA